MIEHRVYGNVKDISLDQLQKIFKDIKYAHIVLLFGSRANHTHTIKSDYDFAVLAEEREYDFGLRAKLLADISEITKLDMRDIDIVDLKKADKFILNNIKENYIILKGDKSEVARVLRQN